MTKPDLSPEGLEIEQDEAMNREYIPLPGGWEVQTKGRGSTLRLLDTKIGERHPLPLGEEFMIEFFERFAREVNAACRALATERRNDFLAGARAMRQASAEAAEVCDSPYAVPTPEDDDVCTAMSLRIAATIRAIDPASLTEKSPERGAARRRVLSERFSERR